MPFTALIGYRRFAAQHDSALSTHSHLAGERSKGERGIFRQVYWHAVSKNEFISCENVASRGSAYPACLLLGSSRNVIMRPVHRLHSYGMSNTPLHNYNWLSSDQITPAPPPPSPKNPEQHHLHLKPAQTHLSVPTVPSDLQDDSCALSDLTAAGCAGQSRRRTMAQPVCVGGANRRNGQRAPQPRRNERRLQTAAPRGLPICHN